MKNSMTVEIYRDAIQQWRWRIRHQNGEIIADGGEGYQRRGDLIRTLRRMAWRIVLCRFSVAEK